MKIPNYVQEKLIKLLPELIRNKRKVCLYPAGALTEALLGSNLLNAIDIVAIGDRDPARFPGGISGHRVVTPDEIPACGIETILVCSIDFRIDIMAALIPISCAQDIVLVDLCEMAPTGATTEGRLGALQDHIHRLESMQALLWQQETRMALSEPRFADRRRLEPFGYKCYSQADEDGILAEIIRRLGDRVPRSFVECGVGDGLENNTLLLLKQGWQGLWVEGSPFHGQLIRRRFTSYLDKAWLRLTEAFIDRDNINALITPAFTGPLGVLSIDVDGNDYHIWQAISAVDPAIVVIEYNAKFPPPLKWSIDYDADHVWKLDDYQGASLAAMYELGRQKGYRLVGCNLTGVNAFFVREDLVDDQFLVSDDPADHYNPPRVFLINGYKAAPANPRAGRFWE